MQTRKIPSVRTARQEQCLPLARASDCFCVTVSVPHVRTPQCTARDRQSFFFRCRYKSDVLLPGRRHRGTILSESARHCGFSASAVKINLHLRPHGFHCGYAPASWRICESSPRPREWISLVDVTGHRVFPLPERPLYNAAAFSRRVADPPARSRQEKKTQTVAVWCPPVAAKRLNRRSSVSRCS